MREGGSEKRVGGQFGVSRLESKMANTQNLFKPREPYENGNIKYAQERTRRDTGEQEAELER